MARAGKGKFSNDLVAASCAAVLSVYAAGYWRTRDEARRIETRAHERRPPLPERSAVAGTQSAALEAAAPKPQPPPETRPVISPPLVAAAPSATAVAAKVSSTATAAAPPPAVASPQAAASTVETSVVAAAVTSAIEPAPAIVATSESQPVPAGNWRDGTYTGWGTSRHGDIKSRVVIRNGRIVESSIASCETRYPCDVISSIIHQPVERQNPEVDRVSRATESADAYYFGLVEALDEALVQPSTEATTPR